MVVSHLLCPMGSTAFQSSQKLNYSHFLACPMNEEQRIRDLILALDRAQLSDTVRDLTIRLRRKNRLKLPDAIIAASAMAQQAILLTNDQTFASIVGLNCKALQLK